MKFVSREQVFDALANAAVVEYAQRHWVRDWVWEKAGREFSATWGVPRGVAKVRWLRLRAWRSRMAPLSLLGAK
jgi:hypothetical protein